MDALYRILAELADGKRTVEQAQADLADLVRQTPEFAPDYLRVLNDLYKSRRIAVADYSRLNRAIMKPDDVQTGAGGVTDDPLAALDAADDEPEDAASKTQFRMPTVTSQQSAAQTGAGAGGASDDATRFRPHDPSRRSTTGGSPPSQTSGTGSNWSHPSGWTGVPGRRDDGEPVAIGSVVDDRFVLEQVIGKGGMGIVFRARDMLAEEAQDRKPYVAMKVLNEEFKRHPESLKALQRESRKAQTLSHPNIVNVFYFGRDGGTVFMTMELLEGQPLDKLIRERKGIGLHWNDAFPMIRDMARALAHAHSKNIIHSDFKPGNCFLTEEGPVKVFDFGIARAAKRTGELSGDETLFDAGTLGALTPPYATCEMIDGEEPDQRDDVYALACTAYELLAGRHPYDKKSAADAVKNGLAPKPIPKLPRQKFKALTRGLALARNDRTPSALAFLEELNPKKTSRNILLAVAAVAVTLVIALAVVMVPRYLYQQRVEETRALLESDDIDSVREGFVALGELDDRDVAVFRQDYADKIIDLYDQEIGLAFNRDRELFDYPRARSLLDELEADFGERARVVRIAEQVEKDRQELQAEFAAAYEALIENDQMLPDAGDGLDVYEIRRRVGQIDPNDPLLGDVRLPQKLAAAAVAAAQDESFDDAEQYLASGFAVAPDNPVLVDARDNVEVLQQTVERAAEVQRIEDDIRAAQRSDDPGWLNAAMLNDVRRLTVLSPDSALLARAVSNIERAFSDALDAELDQRQWDSARSRLEGLADIVTPAYQARSSNAIDRAQETYREAIDLAVSRVDAVVANVSTARDSLPAARRAIAQLESVGAEAETVAQEQDRIAIALLSAAQASRSQSEWDRARELADAAQQLAVTGVVREQLVSELAKIDGQETLAVKELREQEIRGLKDRLTARVNATAFSQDSLNDALRDLGALEQNFADAPGIPEFLAQTRTSLVTRVSETADSLASANRFPDANALLDAAEDAFGSRALAAARASVAAARRAQLNAAQQERIEQLRQRLSELLANLLFEETWVAQFERTLASLEDADPGNAFLTEARERAANSFVQDAAQRRAESRWSIAQQRIELAQRLAPTMPAVLTEARTIETQYESVLVSRADEQRQAEIDGKRDQFDRELAAGRPDKAEAILDDLAPLLGPRDAFLTSQAPRALVEAYVTSARRDAREHRYTLALQQLDRANGFQSSDPRIAADRAEYELKRSAYRTVASGSPSAVAALGRDLSTLKASAPDYAEFYTKLEDLLTSRVRDLAQTNYDGAESLLASGNTVFPAVQVTLTPPTSPGNGGRVADQAAPQPPVVAVTPPPSQPVARGNDPCRNVPPGQGGGRSSRNRCRDILPDDVRGPIMVVVPGVSGGAPFAITRSEITIRDYNAYCSGSGECGGLSGSGTLPATSIDVSRMQAYARWVSQATGFSYQLPTRDQWLHAARADGAALDPNVNCLRKDRSGNIERGFSLEEVSSGRDSANAWGLWHIVGNAQEVVSGSGGWRSVGGGYTDRVRDCRPSLDRSYDGPGEATGFRLVRSIR